MMRILAIGKLPPIEGGVSARTYWLARGLAERGHDVSVVTNALDVEPEYRIHMTVEDEAWLEPRTRGTLRVRFTPPVSARTWHIPRSNAGVTKLSATATEFAMERPYDIIYAHYFEPYAVAGWLTATFTSTKFVVQHAGSDISRLMGDPDLARTYKEIARRADGFVGAGALRRLYAGMGISLDRLHLSPRFGLRPELFSPEGPDLAIGRYQEVSRCWPGPLPDGTPVVGIYGKVGHFKGSLDLLHALAALARANVPFALVAMVGGRAMPQFLSLTEELGLHERVWSLPFLPHWRVPEFIRRCDVVCFLEHDFPIRIHGPVVPREVMACGRCLVLSREIADKQYFADRLRPGENFILVDDPSDHAALADALHGVISDSVHARRIGAVGRALYEDLRENYEDFIGDYEEIFGAVIRKAMPSTTQGQAQGRNELRLTLPNFLPTTTEVLGAGFDSALDAFCVRSVIRTSVAVTAIEFGEFVVCQYADAWDVRHRDAVKYEVCRASLHVSDFWERKGPAFTRGNRVKLPDDSAIVGQMRPELSRYVRIESFESDPRSSSATEADGTAPSRTFVFHYLTNLDGRVYLIDEHSAALLRVCDGHRTCVEVARAAGLSTGRTIERLLAFWSQGLVGFAPSLSVSAEIAPGGSSGSEHASRSTAREAIANLR